MIGVVVLMEPYAFFCLILARKFSPSLSNLFVDFYPVSGNFLQATQKARLLR